MLFKRFFIFILLLFSIEYLNNKIYSFESMVTQIDTFLFVKMSNDSFVILNLLLVSE